MEVRGWILDTDELVFRKYAVDEKDEKTVPICIVSTKWLEHDEQYVYCLWPTYFKTDATRMKAVEQHAELKTDLCEKNKVNVKYTTGKHVICMSWSG